MIADIANILVFGKPVIIYVGLLTLLSLLFTASIGYTNYKGIKGLPFKYHPLMAAITITLAAIHVLLELGIYFNF